MEEKPSEKHPHSFFSFWRQAIKGGWDKSREKFGSTIDLVALLLAIALVFVVWFSKHHKDFNEESGEAFVNYWLAVIPLGLWLIWFIYHVLKAPYEIYLEQYQKHEIEIGEKDGKVKTLEAEIERFNNQTTPLLVGYEITQHLGGLSTSCTIVLKNPNPTQDVDGVELALISISPPVPHTKIERFTTDLLKLLAIEFSPYGMHEKMLTGSQEARFPVFVVFETNPPTGIFFHFTGEMAGLDNASWHAYNHFSPEPGREYTLTLHARARGLKQAEKQFKLIVSPMGQKPQITIKPA
jgi:hypothetical protein